MDYFEVPVGDPQEHPMQDFIDQLESVGVDITDKAARVGVYCDLAIQDLGGYKAGVVLAFAKEFNYIFPTEHGIAEGLADSCETDGMNSKRQLGEEYVWLLLNNQGVGETAIAFLLHHINGEEIVDSLVSDGDYKYVVHDGLHYLFRVF
jgi:hypothetical protein